MPALAFIPAMSAATAISAVGATAAVVGTGYSIYANERANKQSKAFAKAEQARNDLRAARERRETIRSARAAYASAQQSAENQGVSASSASQGGLASIGAQLQSNLSFLDQYKTFTDQAGEAYGRMQTWKARSDTAGSVASFGMSAANNAEGIVGTFNRIFK